MSKKSQVVETEKDLDQEPIVYQAEPEATEAATVETVEPVEEPVKVYADTPQEIPFSDVFYVTKERARLWLGQSWARLFQSMERVAYLGVDGRKDELVFAGELAYNAVKPGGVFMVPAGLVSELRFVHGLKSTEDCPEGFKAFIKP